MTFNVPLLSQTQNRPSLCLHGTIVGQVFTFFKFPQRKLKKSYFMACLRGYFYVYFAYYCSSKFL